MAISATPPQPPMPIPRLVGKSSTSYSRPPSSSKSSLSPPSTSHSSSPSAHSNSPNPHLYPLQQTATNLSTQTTATTSSSLSSAVASTASLPSTGFPSSFSTNALSTTFNPNIAISTNNTNDVTIDGNNTNNSLLPASPNTLYLHLLHRTPAPAPFVYGVISTRIYCLPNCPARLARRANIAFFPDPAAAAAVGYRPCKRCKPDECFPKRPFYPRRMDGGGEVVVGENMGVVGSVMGGGVGGQGSRGRGGPGPGAVTSSSTYAGPDGPIVVMLPAQRRQHAAVARACQLLLEQRREGKFRVAEVAREVGMTRWHFGRVFRKVMGLGPGEWARRLKDVDARAGGGEDDGEGEEEEEDDVVVARGGGGGGGGGGVGGAGGPGGGGGPVGGASGMGEEWGEGIDDWMWCEGADRLDWGAWDGVDVGGQEAGGMFTPGVGNNMMDSGNTADLDWDQFLNVAATDFDRRQLW